jgi:predicted DNA-binding protein YlxM (UPF0122 family)
MVKVQSIKEPIKKKTKALTSKKEKVVLFNGNKDFNEIWNNVVKSSTNSAKANNSK